MTDADRPVAYDGFAGMSWLSTAELDFLVETMPRNATFLELGTASGVTAAKLADARPDVTILCLDIFVDHDQPHVTENEPHRVSLWFANKRANMRLWLGTFEQLLELCPSIRFDAILVDADHEKPSVLRDLEAANLVLRRDGVMFAHDCDEPGWPGVTQAVEWFAGSRGYAAVGQRGTLRAMRRVAP